VAQRWSATPMPFKMCSGLWLVSGKRILIAAGMRLSLWR